MTIFSIRVGLDLLNLLAYSNQIKEFDIVKRYFDNNEFRFESNPTVSDSFDRRGVLYTLTGERQVKRFEDNLEVDFTSTEVSFRALAGGSSYRCMRIKEDASVKRGCIDLKASDEDAAFIKCCLHASMEHWFGGKSERGRCEDI